MDSTWTTGQAASSLGVSVPTIRRALGRLDLHPPSTPGGHLRLAPDEMAALRAHLGVVPPVDGLSRPQVQVLAALARSPLGLRSERSIGRAAGLSATAVGGAVDALVAAGLVGREERVLAEGRAVVGSVWRIATGPAWFAIADRVAAVQLPTRASPAPPRTLPRRFWHLFWNADPSALDLERDADMIAVRMLLGDDLEALAWACAHLPADSLRRAARNRGADARIRALVENVLVAA